MDKKQKIAMGVPPFLTVMMLGVYHGAAKLLDPDSAWYAVFWIYWLVWCLLGLARDKHRIAPLVCGPSLSGGFDVGARLR